jgi:hypothetical protein
MEFPMHIFLKEMLSKPQTPLYTRFFLHLQNNTCYSVLHNHILRHGIQSCSETYDIPENMLTMMVNMCTFA